MIHWQEDFATSNSVCNYTEALLGVIGIQDIWVKNIGIRDIWAEN